MAQFTPMTPTEDVDLGSEEPFWGGPVLNETLNERAERILAIPNHTLSSSDKILKARELCRLGLNLYFHQNWNWAVMLFSHGIVASSRGIPWNTGMIDYYVEMVEKCRVNGTEQIFVDFLNYYFAGLLKVFAFQMWQLKPTSSDYAKYQKYAKEREENGNNFYTNIARNAEWRQNHKELLATFLTYYSQELEESSKSKLAESCLKLAIELWPEYSDSYWQMGDCLIKKEDLNGAWQVLSKAVEVMPPDDKFYGLVCYKAMYVRLMLMNGANNQEAVKDCTKIYEKVLVWENKIEKKYPFDHNDNVWRNNVKSQLSQFVSLASIGKKERNLTDPTKCTVCHTSGVKISRCGRCKKTWYCGVACQRADWPVHKPNCM